MTKKTIDLDHAKHNYNLYEKLLNEGGFDDWVITVGFYSALKYLQDSLFPGEYICPYENKIKIFNSFSEYISANRSLNKANPHRLLENVVETYIDSDDVKNSYKDLKNACFFARYINYNVGKDRLNMAREAILVIKKYNEK